MADDNFAEMFSASLKNEKEKNRRKTAPVSAPEHPPVYAASPPDDDGDDERWRDCGFFAANGVDKRKAKRDLTRRYPVEDELSLREMTVAEARRELYSFLDDAQARGLRCVEVIHGRGRNSPGGVSVLQAKTRKWLARRVKAFMEIPGNPGGVRALLWRDR